MEPKISVIVPAYNNAPWLPRCLDSILAQTYENLEVIAVNDGSTDDTARVLDAYAEKDARVRAIHKENGGVTSARLRGVEESAGDWIGFVDGDDFIEPQMYADLMKNARQHGADISHCGHRMVYPGGEVRYFYNTGLLRLQNRETGIRDLLEERIMEPGLCNKLYRRSLFAGLEQRMDGKIRNNEDLLMNYYLFREAEKLVFEDVCPYHYLIREGSASQQKLNYHRIYDPITVKQIIFRDCDGKLREDAARALVSTSLFAYAQLCRGMEKQYEQDQKQVRTMIREQRSYSGLLSAKNALMVHIISTAPWIFHGVYGAYYRFIKKI